MSLEKFFKKNKEFFQLAYGVILIFLIPLFLIYNTLFLIENYNKSINVSLQKHSLSTGKNIMAYLNDGNENKIQEKLDILEKNNNEIIEITYSKKEGDTFVAIASTQKEKIGEESGNYFYHLSFNQKEGEGIATDSKSLNTQGEEKVESERYWLVGMPYVVEENKSGVLSLKISSKIVDDLTTDSRNKSIVLLIVEIVVVVLFLLLAVRFWDYVLLYKKAKEVEEMKDEFISMASHELRTPVTGIKGYSSMILDGSFGEVSEKVINASSMIKNASERLGSLVEDLLNVSRIEQGRMEFKKEPINTKLVIKEVVDEISIQAEEKNLKLSFNPHDENLPSLELDKDKLKQILVNIIGNSIKYTEKGSVVVSTYQKDKNFLAISIKDTGIGMNEEERKRLFQKFYRIKNKETEKINGTGLGLWITKQIVELMEGKIYVDSIKGMGTEISLVFPLKNNL